MTPAKESGRMKMKKKIDLGKLAVFYSNYGVFFVLLIVFIGASLYTQNLDRKSVV